MQIQNGHKKISELENREKSYVERLSDLEQQLQQEKEKNESLLPLQDRNDEINNFMKNIEELTARGAKLQTMLSEKVKICTRNNSYAKYA